MESHWYIFNKRKQAFDLSEQYGISKFLSIILCNRNINNEHNIKMMLSDNIEDLNDEKLLPDIEKACDVLHQYIDNKKNIRIVGDYDIDGICSTYILYEALKNVGANISYDIPDRIYDGYGINFSIIDNAVRDKIDLIITCDNGIAAKEQIDYAVKNSIKVIVTDHHDVGDIPKNAIAVVNPKREDLEVKYPFKEICGAVVVLKLLLRYFDKYENNRQYIFDNFLEFAMLATVGDIMPLVNENHILVKLGLIKIKNSKNKGLMNLLTVSDLNDKKITPYHIGYIIGPLINAAGRMDKATTVLKLLLSNDDREINEITNKLKELNNERKTLTEDGFKKTVELIEEKYINDKVFVIYVDGLKEQVAGIVAGRIKEKYYRPTIILTSTIDDNEAKASCRSIDQYDIFNELNRFNSMFLKFGGHKLAAGFSILKKDIDLLRKKLNDNCILKEDDFIPKVYIDLEFPCHSFNLKHMEELDKLEPFGKDFEKPIFVSKDVNTQIVNIYGDNKNVVKLRLLKDGHYSQGIIFTDSKPLIDKLNSNHNINILYYPKINNFMGKISIEFNIIDYK